MKILAMTLNKDGLADTVALAREMGVPYLIDHTMTPRYDGSMVPLSYQLLGDELARVVAWATAATGGTVTPSAPVARVAVPCVAGRTQVSITPFGEVYPCLNLPVSAGNVRERPFGEIWRRGTPMVEIRERAGEEIPECATCEDRDFCGRCPGKAYQEDGSAFGPSRSACRDARIYHQLHDAALAGGEPLPVTSLGGCAGCSGRGGI
jgi:radical SAM protein with 4Fe4S-binding SPASM domain